MPRVGFLVLLTALLPAGAALAHEHGGHTVSVNDGAIRPPVEWARRHDTARARFVAPTRDGSAVLLITGGKVVVQLGDRTPRQLDRELESEQEDEDDGALASAIKGAVIGGVRGLLSHSLECPIVELRDVGYREGRLELITRHGDRVFEDIEINDRDLLEDFSPRDARAFVAEFDRLKRRGR
jgi:hypothetical protein